MMEVTTRLVRGRGKPMYYAKQLQVKVYLPLNLQAHYSPWLGSYLKSLSSTPSWVEVPIEYKMLPNYDKLHVPRRNMNNHQP